MIENRRSSIFLCSFLQRRALEALPVLAAFIRSLLFSLEPAPGFGFLKLVLQDFLVPRHDQIRGSGSRNPPFPGFLSPCRFSCHGSSLPVPCLLECPGLSVQASLFSAYLCCLGDSRTMSLNPLRTLGSMLILYL